MNAKTYWDSQYKSSPFLHGKEPSHFLQRMMPRLQKGKALEIAMGEGVDSVFFAQKGFEVKGFDISEQAVSNAKQLATDTGVDLEVQCTDMDLFLLGIMEYDTIYMKDFKPTINRCYPEIIKALKQGGTLLVESQLTSQMKEVIPRGEEFRDFYFGPNELLKHIKDLRILFYSEGEEDGVKKVQCLARKPIDKDAIKYNLFDMHSGKEIDEDKNHLELAAKLFKD